MDKTTETQYGNTPGLTDEDREALQVLAMSGALAEARAKLGEIRNRARQEARAQMVDGLPAFQARLVAASRDMQAAQARLGKAQQSVHLAHKDLADREIVVRSLNSQIAKLTFGTQREMESLADPRLVQMGTWLFSLQNLARNAFYVTARMPKRDPYTGNDVMEIEQNGEEVRFAVDALLRLRAEVESMKREFLGADVLPELIRIRGEALGAMRPIMSGVEVNGLVENMQENAPHLRDEFKPEPLLGGRLLPKCPIGDPVKRGA